MAYVTLNLEGVSCVLLNVETNKKYSLIYNDPQEIEDGIYDISLTVNDNNYDIVSAKIVVDPSPSPEPSKSYNLTISSDKKSASITLDLIGFSNIKGSLEKGLEPIETIPITLSLMDVSCVLLNKETNEQYSLIYNESQNIPKGKYDISLTVIDDNYNIVSAVIDIDQSPVPSEPYNFTISSDKKSAVFSLDMSKYTYINSASIRGKLEKGNGEPDIVGTFNNLYEIDSENLRKLTNNVVLKEKDNPIQHYIINLVRMPFKLDNSIVGGDEGIIIGNEVFTSPSSKKLKVDKISVDLGVIEIPYKYNNSYDFLNTNCYLHLPFSQTIELDCSYVIGETISIKYELSLYDGAGTINIYSSKIGDVFLSVPVKVGVTIPYFNKGNDSYSNKNVELLNIYNNLKNAYMEVIRNIPYNSDSLFNTNITTKTVLKNEKGYVKINNIILESKASFDEKNRIINLLSQGVYIK